MPSSFKRQVAGQPLAQVDNPDPFAVPVWRSPVYQTPHVVIWPVQLVRLVWRLVWFVLRHPLLDARVRGCWSSPGSSSAGRAWSSWWPSPSWRWRRCTCCGRNGSPGTSSRRRGTSWRHWFYRRRWQAAMTLAGLAPTYRGRVLVPVLVGVRAAGAVDLVTVRLVTGQAPHAFADRTQNLAHAFGAQLCRVRDARPGLVTLEFVQRRHPRRPDRRASRRPAW